MLFFMHNGDGGFITYLRELGCWDRALFSRFCSYHGAAELQLGTHLGRQGRMYLISFCRSSGTRRRLAQWACASSTSLGLSTLLNNLSHNMGGHGVCLFMPFLLANRLLQPAATQCSHSPPQRWLPFLCMPQIPRLTRIRPTCKNCSQQLKAGWMCWITWTVIKPTRYRKVTHEVLSAYQALLTLDISGTSSAAVSVILAWLARKSLCDA